MNHHAYRVLALLLLLSASLGACRTGHLVPLTEGLEAHVTDAEGAHAAGAAGEDLALEAKTRAIMAAWDAKLMKPGALPLLRAFSAKPYVALRAEARADAFAVSLAEGLQEQQLLAAVFERNPRIRAAYLKLRGTVNQYAQVTQLNMILSQYASFQRSSMTRVGMPLAGDRVDQAFPFPGALELKAALVNHALEESQARYSGVVRDRVVEARSTFARYGFVGRALAITQATVLYLEQLEDAARGKLRAGTGAKSAVIQVQVELAKLRNELITLQQDRGVLQAAIARLVDVAPDTAVGAPTPPTLPGVPTDPASLRSTALVHQPDVRAAEARVRRMVTMIELAEQTTFPPFSAGLSTMEGVSHATGGSDKEREPFSTRPKIKPDPMFGPKEAYLREAREGAQAASSRATAARNQTAFAVQRAYAELQTADRLHRLYRDVQLAQAEQAYRDAASGYAAGRVEFLNVVDSLRRWLRFRLSSDRAIRDIHMAHARLEGAVGRSLAK